MFDLTDPTMLRVLRQVVEDQEIVEVGGAGGELAFRLVQVFNAQRVIVIEKERQKVVNPDPRVQFFWGYVAEFNQHAVFGQKSWPVGIVSWPINNAETDRSTITLFRRCAKVVVIGKNDGLTACGTSILWEYLVKRERLHTVEWLANDMAVYGPNPRTPLQPMSRLELAGVNYDSCPTITPLLPSAKN